MPKNSKISILHSRNQTRLNQWMDSAADSRTQITQTVYDEQYTPVNLTLDAKNLRSRVSYTRYFTIADSAESGGHQSATYYSYDVHGNVDSLLLDYRDIAGMNRNNRFKKIVYRYDLISGKVNEVTYQPGQPDAFHHRYYYDAENRLIEVETSKDSVIWEQDASYTYYKHGPLARVLLGHQSVQGVDYAYTLQGWLKGVNTTAVATSPNPSEGGGHTPFDMGVDSMPVAKDAYGFALYYYGQNDYKPIGGVRSFANADTGIVAFKPLYNGNIAAMAVNIPKVGEPLLYKYSYDQLNRITGMDAYRGLNVTSNTWTPISTTSFKERVSYDANGNILSYLRNGNNLIGKPLAMDSMTYHYIAGTNQLDYISDPVNKNNYKEDIDNQLPGNYVYDSIGNLIKDNAEKIQSIDWTVYGKISRILKTDTTEISYIYDAAGQRIAKAVKKNNITDSTYYVRDASGNVMSVYEHNDTVSRGHVLQKEIDLYGSSRLGMLIAETDVDTTLPVSTTVYFMRRKKLYELTDHRGNVMVVVSDVKKPIRSTVDTNLVRGYEPVVITATDYYPFGMQMPGRHGFATESGTWHGSYAFSIPPYLFVDHRGGNTPLEYVASQTIELSNGFLTGAGSDNYVAYIADSASMAALDSAYQLVGGGYRYGFNGQEHDYDNGQEMYTALYWEYDSRSGRRWNIDPLSANYPWQSPYSVFNNTPIFYNDPSGASGEPPKDQKVIKTASGGHMNIPANATVEVFVSSTGTTQNTKTNITVAEGSVRAFNVDNKRYTASFNKDGNFTGYNDVSDMKTQYTPEAILYQDKVSSGFKNKLLEISYNLGHDPNKLMAVFAQETGETFSPSIKSGDGQVGLIQFTGTAIKQINSKFSSDYTKATLVKMSAEDQLVVVQRYFQSINKTMVTIDDYALATFSPKNVGKTSSTVIYSKGSDRYTKNRGLDTDRDGNITVGEVGAKYAKKYVTQ